MSAILEKDEVIKWPQQSLPVIARAGVLVCGGGVAGVAAATAAGRAEADVFLVERNAFLGGAATASGMGQWGVSSVGMSGLAVELLDRLVRAGGAFSGGSVIPIDPETFKDIACEMVTAAGARILFYANILDVVMEGNRVRGIVVQSKSGPKAILADVTIDATGDADVSFYAGVPCVKGRESDGKMRPITLLFRLGNVDLERVVHFVRDNPRDFVDNPDRNVIDLDRKLLRVMGYFSQVEAARGRGELDPECHYIRLEGVFVDRRIVIVNNTRVYGVDGTDPFDLTRAEFEGRKQMHQLIAFLRHHAPGFELSLLVDSGPSLGVRETRRIIGEYILTGEDIFSDRTFPDTVARMYMRNVPGFKVHSPDAKEGSPEDTAHRTNVIPIHGYNFPFRSLLPQHVDNLLVAGRCVSVDHEADGWVRDQPHAILLGQAAGTAAAAAIGDGVAPRGVNVQQLQNSLRRQGVDLGEAVDRYR